ncbi:calcium-binding protein [Magnetovibrio sp. PR-2]|uniref:calcium-binding protein n=1 Tax=Magnetovibrio sp. PR-2 TaxID=3120356 RepID=UPI002FCE18D8
MTTIDPPASGIRIDPNVPILSMKDLIDEAQSFEKLITDLGEGASVTLQGPMIKMTGMENYSPQAIIAAIQASEMGGEAGAAMFATYRKTHPEDFDGSRTFDVILAGADHPQKTPPPQRHKSASDGQSTDDASIVREVSHEGSLYGTSHDDYLEVLHNAQLWGLAGNDVLIGGDNSELFGGAGDDELLANQSSTLHGGSGNDTLTGGHWSTLYGDSGDDVLFGGQGSTLHGGSGDDTMTGGHWSTLNGDSGDDVLFGGQGSTLNGGSGDDHLTGQMRATLDGGAGDDRLEGKRHTTVEDKQGSNFVRVQDHSTVETGDGDDWIEAYDRVFVYAGDGANMVQANDYATVYTGDGDDSVTVQNDGTVFTGDGNDRITVWDGATISAGAGDDQIYLKGKDAVVHFNVGDGHDIIAGGRWGTALAQTHRISSATLSFGEGIEAEDLTFQASGNDLTIGFKDANDSLVLRDVQRHGIASMAFADGTVLRSEDISNFIGEVDAFTPKSEVMQNWYNATKAYQASKNQSSG